MGKELFLLQHNLNSFPNGVKQFFFFLICSELEQSYDAHFGTSKPNP